jgi:hypothetical protein
MGIVQKLSMSSKVYWNPDRSLYVLSLHLFSKTLNQYLQEFITAVSLSLSLSLSVFSIGKV